MTTPNIFLLSGTPGSGKTTIARELGKKHDFHIITIGDIVIKENLYSGIDQARDSKIIDMDKFDEFFNILLQKLSTNSKDETQNIVFECHYADLIESDQIEAAVILRCQPTTVESRLKPRGYSFDKIKENAMAEYLGVCTSHMLENHSELKSSRMFEIDTTSLSIEKVVEIVNQIFKHPESSSKYKAGQLSWLSDPNIHINRYL